MQKIVVINIDPFYRAGYSAMIAAALYKLNPAMKISLVCSSDEELYESIGIFEHIFVLQSDEISGGQIKETLRNRNPELFETSWDISINHSSCTEAASLTAHLTSAEIFGPVLNKEDQLTYQDFSSYLLSKEEKTKFLPSHILQIYSEIISFTDRVERLPSSWSEFHQKGLENKFLQLRSFKSKTDVIMLDSCLVEAGDKDGLHFIIRLFKKLSEHSNFLPVLLSSNIEEDSFLISKLRENLSDEINVMTATDRSILALVSNVNLLITNNLRLKTIADLVSCPSVFVCGKNDFPLSDFSINSKSLLLHSDSLSAKDVDHYFEYCSYVLSREEQPQLKTVESEVFITVKLAESYFLLPYNQHSEDDSQYLEWYLIYRYVLKLQDLSSPDIKFGAQEYNKLAKKELKIIKEVFSMLLERVKETDELDRFTMSRIQDSSKILQIGLKYLEFNKKYNSSSIKKFLADTKPIVKKAIEFLSKEEN